MIEGYWTVAEGSENTIIIERSKFICSIKNVDDESCARDFIDEVRKKHSLATHNCYAYIADDKGLVQKFSDDGEPQGTAGLPMLEVLKNKRMFKTAVVVTRYFGGVKLGTGGLTRAYSGSVVECLSKAKVVNMLPSDILQIKPDYEQYSKLLKLLSDENIRILNTDFSNRVEVNICVKKEFTNGFLRKITDCFNGKLDAVKINEGYCAF